MHKTKIVVRPDGVSAGPDVDIAEEIRECRVKAHQMRHRAKAESDAAKLLRAGIDELGGVSLSHPLALAHLAAVLKAQSSTLRAEEFEATIALLEAGRAEQ